MPKLKLYPNGFSVACVSNHKRKPGKRDVCGGWSYASARSCLLFLLSVDKTELTGFAVSFTHTIRDCPESPERWRRCVKAFVQWLMDNEALYLHYVTEWQRRGIPHLHGCVFFPNEEHARRIERKMSDAWLRIAAPYEPSHMAQYVKPVFDLLGWLNYLAKHAARCRDHYQRSPENIPALWKARTGRMWGKRGEWPCRSSQTEIPLEMFYRIRRLIRAHRVSVWRDTYRKTGKPIHRKAIGHARRSLRGIPEDRSRFSGSTEWFPQSEFQRYLEQLSSWGGATAFDRHQEHQQ